VGSRKNWQKLTPKWGVHVARTQQPEQMKLPSLFYCQFEAMAGHSTGQTTRKPHLLAVLHGVPTEVRYEDITEALRDHYGDHQLATDYCSQLKNRTQLVGKCLQRFATTSELLAHWGLVGLLHYFIHREAACAFANRIRDQEVEFPLLMDGERMLNEALGQA
jgi:hypothetical protein